MNFKVYDLIILAGGKGTRIKKYLNNNPKPLIKIDTSSILDKILFQVCKYQFRRIFILTGYKSEKIFKKFNNKLINFNKITCIREKKLLGTGGYIKKNLNQFTKSFYVMNADSYCDFDYYKFKDLKISNAYGKIILTKNNDYKSNKKLSNLIIDKNNKVKLSNKKNGLMNAGIYFFKRKCFEQKVINNSHISLEDEIILPLIKDNKILGLQNKNFFLDIGTPKNLLRAKNLFKKNLLKPGIFLDRDGTINEDYGYVHDFNKFKLKKNILKTLKYLKNKKVYFFIVTNQAGIAKKKFTLNEFNIFHAKFKNFFSKEKIYFDYVAFCPFHKDALLLKYKKKSNYRKPGNLMVKFIVKNFYVDLKKSIFIGDSKKDYLCAKKSNLKFIYYSKNIIQEIKKYY